MYEIRLRKSDNGRSAFSADWWWVVGKEIDGVFRPLVKNDRPDTITNATDEARIAMDALEEDDHS